jgi:type IV secretory pathway VirB3-like protein
MSSSIFCMTLAAQGVTALLIVAVVMGAFCFWARLDVADFLSKHAAIESDETLQIFKAMVRRQMIIAIGVLAMGILFILLCMFVTMQLLLLGFLLILCLATPLFLFAHSTKKLEARARTLVCADERRRAEYTRVGSAWIEKLFPDF